MKPQTSLKNMPRPAAYISVKHIILNAKDSVDVKQAEKAIDNYIYGICEKSLREERKLDLQYILNWKIGEMKKDGFRFEDEILNMYHQRLSPK